MQKQFWGHINRTNIAVEKLAIMSFQDQCHVSCVCGAGVIERVLSYLLD